MALPRITQKEMTENASSVNLKHCWIGRGLRMVAY